MKKFVSFVCAMSMFISTCFGFSDVSKDHWGYKAINSIHKTGIVTGFYDNTFKPDEKVTKEQLATILTIAFNLTGEYSYKFEDVEENNWSNNYIKATWKYFSNIKRGDKYYFEPEMPITREEVAKTMVKVLNIDTSNVDLFILDQFTDRNEFFTATSKSEEMYIALAVQHGIMKGKGGYFAPKDTLTRAEIAAIMYNILGENGEETMTYSDFDLLAYMPETENYMISPFSIKMAMMMAANGAEGETQNEILKAFGIEDIDEYNKFSKEIIKNYNNNENIKLNVANSIWLNTDKEALAQFNEEYKKIITEYFAGTANEVNNSNAVQVINDWCSEKTNGKIEEIITSPDFLAALVNAIYFKGEWRNKFDEYDTVKDEFIAYDDSIVEKEFMNQIKTFNYYEDETMQLVEMPYRGYNTSMYVVLPKINDEINIKNAVNNVKPTRVMIKLPKFKVEFSQKLNGILVKMGIEKAFSQNEAEFKNKMFVNLLENAYISEVLHKTFIEVDENGTEAAAVTAVLMKTMAAFVPVEDPKEFIADKPFIYFIRDNNSGAILFMGEIVK